MERCTEAIRFCLSFRGLLISPSKPATVRWRFPSIRLAFRALLLLGVEMGDVMVTLGVVGLGLDADEVLG